MTSAFILGPDDEAVIREAARRALANPLTFKTVMRVQKYGATDEDGVLHGDRPDDAPEPQEVNLPLGWRLAISCEEQPFGLCFHLSMSSPTPAKTLPRPEAFKMVLDVLGCGESPGVHWIEEFKERGRVAGRAVNVVVQVPKDQKH
jgi:hypothetical protein